MLVEKHTELNIGLGSKSGLGNHILREALEDSDSKIAEILINVSDNVNIDLNLTGEDRNTVLHIACTEGFPDIVGKLISQLKTLTI